METLDLIEEYNPEGVCIRRTINGYELPSDTEPSIQIFRQLNSVTTKKYLTKEEAKHIYNYHHSTHLIMPNEVNNDQNHKKIFSLKEK